MGSRRRRTISVITALLSLLTVAAAAPQTHDSAPLSRISPAPPEPLRLESFADRLHLKVGETVNVTVWVESPPLEAAQVTISFARDQLVLQGAETLPVTLPMPSPLHFALRAGTRPGKSNLLIRVTGTQQTTKASATVSQTIQGIEVQAGDRWWLPLVSGPLPGVVIGALLTLGMTLLHERRQRRREETKRQEWVVTHLPAQLEADRIAVSNEQKTDFAAWTSKLLAEGYYAEMQKLTAHRPGLADLPQALLEAGFLLRDYEEARTNNRLANVEKDHLAAQLANIIGRLRQL